MVDRQSRIGELDDVRRPLGYYHRKGLSLRFTARAVDRARDCVSSGVFWPTPAKRAVHRRLRRARVEAANVGRMEGKIGGTSKDRAPA
jgi:hypothetical protein